jgi:hypothetical protein
MPQGTMSRARVNHAKHPGTVRYLDGNGTRTIYQLNEKGELVRCASASSKFFSGENGRANHDAIFEGLDEADLRSNAAGEISSLDEVFQPGATPWPDGTILSDGTSHLAGDGVPPPRRYDVTAVINVFLGGRRYIATALLHDRWHIVTASVTAFVSDGRHVFNAAGIVSLSPFSQDAGFCADWKRIFDDHFPWLEGLPGHVALREYTNEVYARDGKHVSSMKQWMQVCLPILIPPVRAETLPPEEAADLLFQMAWERTKMNSMQFFSEQMTVLMANFFRNPRLGVKVWKKIQRIKKVRLLEQSNFSKIRGLVMWAMEMDRFPGPQ